MKKYIYSLVAVIALVLLTAQTPDGALPVLPFLGCLAVFYLCTKGLDREFEDDAQ